MPHAIVYHGKFEQNRGRLKAGTRVFLGTDRRSRPLPTTTADGIHFGYMTRGLHDFVAVKADSVLLPNPVTLAKGHTDGKGHAPSPTLIGNRAARRLLLDMIAANPSVKSRLIPLFETFLTTQKTLPSEPRTRGNGARLPATLAAGPDRVAIEAAIEGRKRLVTHLKRERSARLARIKKADVLRKTGKLACEVCGFDFVLKYPGIAVPYAEVHHLRPISGLVKPTPTTLRQLALLCSNCHRMIHFTDPMKSPSQLRRLMRRGL